MRQQRLFAPARSARLALAAKPWLTGLDAVREPLPRNHDCTRCALGRSGVKTVCMDGQGTRGGVLVVMPAPTLGDDSAGQPSPHGAMRYVMDAVAEHHRGPARYAFAISCHQGRGKAPDAVELCRPYLAAEFLGDPRPTRVVALGELAAESITGQTIPLLHVRRAWARVLGLPVLFVMHPGAAAHNRIVRKWLDADLRWALTTAEADRPLTGEARVLLTEEEVEEWCSSLRPDNLVAVDIENGGKLWRKDFRLLCVGLCADPTAPVVVPGDVAALPRARGALRRVLEDPRIPKCGQNFKYDRHGLWQALGIDVQGVEADTLLWSRLRESDAPAKLEKLQWSVGWAGYKQDTQARADDDGDRGQAPDFSSLEPDELHLYNARDAASTLAVARWQRPRMRPFLPTWRKLVGPAQDALVRVERWGAHLSEENVRLYDRWLREHLDAVEAKLRQHPETEGVQLSNDHQLRALLFDRLKLPAAVRTEGGLPSVAADALEAIKSTHPVVPLVLDWNRYEKQLTTYGLPVLRWIGYDGRVHSTYGVVRSGRLSSKRPNMQNVTAPAEPGDEGSWARGCWTAEPGNVLVTLDYAQMELRVAAMLAGDETMAAAFEQGEDYHRSTAALIFGVPDDQVTKAQRGIAKNINFGLIYGQTAFGLAHALGITEEQAQGYMDKLFARLKNLGEWRRKLQADAKVTGESWAVWQPETLGWVHRRNIWQAGEVGETKEARRLVKHAMNIALNNPVQNVANCFSLASLTEAVRWIEDERVPARLVSTVHDELTFECPEALAPEIAWEARRIMLSWPSGCVKLKVDVEVGYDWGHTSKLVLPAA